jgi:tubulin polyglutamylase TTLL5
MYSQSTVVQRYVERPLTLNGYKFDLRLYVLVTSFKPLEAFIYKEGFARVSTHQYSLDPKDFDNKFIHLTNASIQRMNEDGPKRDNPTEATEESTGGSKIPLHGPFGLWDRMEKLGMDIDLIWRNICLCVLKSLVVVDEKMPHQPCCFEVFGFDILLDQDLKPWLIEVNASPSMSRDNQLDVRVKTAMITDTIRLVDPTPYDRAAVARVIKRRLTDIAKNKFPMNKNDPQLESDLKDILGDLRPRRVGQVPRHLGDYQKIAPDTKIYQHVLRLKGRIIRPVDARR